MSNNSYIITDDAITVFINCKGLTVNKGDSRYNEVANAIKANDFDSIPEILDLKGTLISEGNGDMYLLNGVLKYKDEVVEPLLGGRIIAMRREGYSIRPYVLFTENLNENPVPTAKHELYGFIENSNLPITEDGHFLAYKMVRKDFTDIYAGTMDNSVGQVVSMERAEVDADRNRTCSSGLHFCSEGYLGQYGTRASSQVVVLKINPRDVVSIPTDYNNAKGRACRYEVIDTIGWDEFITPDFTDKYKSDEDDVVEFNTDDDIDVEYRWEVRDSYNASLIDSYATRGEARNARIGMGEGDVYIWDVHNEVIVDGEFNEPKYRWELRDSDEGSLIDSYATRSEARERRKELGTGFIWDTVNEVVVAGRTNPEFDFTNTYDDATVDSKDTDRWEVRDSHTGAFIHSFSSRSIAREYLNRGEFVWDSEKMVMDVGQVSSSVDLNNLRD